MVIPNNINRRNLLSSMGVASVKTTPLILSAADVTAKPFHIDDCSPMVRAEFHAAKLLEAMQEQCGGNWFTTINEKHRFVLLNGK